MSGNVTVIRKQKSQMVGITMRFIRTDEAIVILLRL